MYQTCRTCDAAQFLGLPEARLPLAEAVIYLAAAPKSNAVIKAIDAAREAVRHGAQHPVPKHLRNATSGLARELGHGEGYVHAHDTEHGVAKFDCLPEQLRDTKFFRPGDRGFELKIRERMDQNEIHRRAGDS